MLDAPPTEDDPPSESLLSSTATASHSIHTSAHTVTTYSSVASAGEVLTDMFSDGELVEPVRRHTIQQSIEEWAPQFEVLEANHSV